MVAILDANGNPKVQYTYDAWGKILSISGLMADTLGAVNPLTYRGYVYDAESGFYYLQSRYYNANVGRFINADSLVSTGQGLLGNNMFAYCGNNPVSNADPGGHLWGLALVVICVAIAFSACTADTMNCYTYALRLESDHKTGKPNIGPIDPGGLAGEDIVKTQLYASPEVVTDLLEEGMKKDAEILDYKFGYVFQPSTHKPAEGNWLIFAAYCPEPSIADYHFWRQEEDGTWSHYIPNKGIKYEDFSGKPITDPLFSDRGKYTEFIGYYEIGPNRGGN